MTLIELKNQFLFVVSQSMGTTIPRLLAILLGLLICLAVIQSIWDRRSIRVYSVFILLSGILMVASGVFPGFLHRLVRMTDPIQLRVLVGILSASVLLVTFESIRRSLLRERYALLWMVTGLFLLLSAFLPESVDIIGALFGTDYWGTVVGILAAFMIFTTFHFSLAFSKHEHNQQKLAQRCAMLESRIESMEMDAGKLAEPAMPVFCAHNEDNPPPAIARLFRIKMPGPYILLLLVIFLSFVSTLGVGLATREPMIGDEVTHYYMLTNQAENLLRPVFQAEIPVGWGEPEVRTYPHVNGWHYLGAVIYRLTGRSIGGVQIYQSLFWLQFLLAAAWLARRRNGKGSRVPVLYVLLLATLPVASIFSVAFYQDIPAAAQVLMAFAMAFYGHWISGLIFMLLALSFKVTSFLFVPAFLVVIALNGYKGWSCLGRAIAARRAALRCAVVGLLVLLCSFGWDVVLEKYADGRYYPFEVVSRTFNSWQEHLDAKQSTSNVTPTAGVPAEPPASSPEPVDRPSLVVTPYEKEIIANHPGDLRLPKNYLIYGGGVLWLVLLLGAGWRLCECAFRKRAKETLSSVGLVLTGIAYVLPTAYLVRTAPDARFFLPAIPFLLLPFVEWVGRSPKIRVTASILSALAILQAGHVYAKVHALRDVPSELREAIAHLKESPPDPARIFMYPEGNYRLFPVPHDWYLRYWLRDFWQGDNDLRLKILKRERIGAIVVKKHLIGEPDAAYTNLGIYPKAFVKDIDSDPRFRKIFENAGIIIYRVPFASHDDS